MPTYEYECKSCGHGFEVFQSMSDPPLKDCPECGKEIRRLIFGGTGVIFKGSGFYITDKNKNSIKTTGKSAGKNESKTASSDNSSKDSSAGGETSAEKSSSERCSTEHGSKERSAKNSSGGESSHSEPSVRSLGGNAEKPELKSKSA